MINFGTDGWRARIGDEFTFDNVKLVTQAIVNYLKESNLIEKGIAIGYDNRFLSEKFAQASAEICASNSLPTYLSKTALPSPALSFFVKNNNLAGGIMITASHNPPEWNGLKFKEGFGGSARAEVTQAIEKYLQKISQFPSFPVSQFPIHKFDPKPHYLQKIKSLVDLDLIRSSHLKVIVDPMHGSGAGYFKELIPQAVEIRGNRDPLFGGVNPEPLPINLEESISFVKETGLKYSSELTACIVLDGDADRLAAIDGTGEFINTHHVFALLLHHLIVHRKLAGNVVKTFNISNLVDKLCQKHQRKLSVTPIGFKYIADKMLKEDVLLGGEESGGMGIKGFIPERDGILAGLMLLELMAYEKKTLGQILDNLMKEHGYFYYDRADIHTDKAQEIVKKLTTAPPNEFSGMKVTKVETLDGLKLNFEDESWILFRASGTEPLLRIYVEGKTLEEVKQILGEGENLIKTA